jgi:thioredoxin-dependent peroxiredoxin
LEAVMAKLPAAGEFAPDFELPDSKGASRRLSELLAQRPAVLLFYRGNW